MRVQYRHRISIISLMKTDRNHTFLFKFNILHIFNTLGIEIKNIYQANFCYDTFFTHLPVMYTVNRNFKTLFTKIHISSTTYKVYDNFFQLHFAIKSRQKDSYILKQKILNIIIMWSFFFLRGPFLEACILEEIPINNATTTTTIKQYQFCFGNLTPRTGHPY